MKDKCSISLAQSGSCIKLPVVLLYTYAHDT